MAELTAAGYTRLRTEEVAGWFVEFLDDVDQVVALVDPGDTSQNRISASDARCSAVDDAGNQTMVITVELTGADIVDALPVTIEAARAFAAASGGTALTVDEAMTPFTFGEVTDEVTVNFRVEVPQQV